jgi:quinol monooxygenase YgiN
MVSLVIDVKVLPGKLREFSQTLNFLIPEFRSEEGCLSYTYKKQPNKPDSISIAAEWNSWSQLEAHFCGARFDIFLGAINVLCEKPHVKIRDQSRIVGMEAIVKAREQESF